ncbi:hypothetical protein OH77DRAFT_1323166 [Trametes cingulata]|nr:hypothetical protein OH77DRAFT_1323166 [Trametes cingulata]
MTKATPFAAVGRSSSGDTTTSMFCPNRRRSSSAPLSSRCASWIASIPIFLSRTSWFISIHLFSCSSFSEPRAPLMFSVASVNFARVVAFFCRLRFAPHSSCLAIPCTGCGRASPSAGASQRGSGAAAPSQPTGEGPLPPVSGGPSLGPTSAFRLSVPPASPRRRSSITRKFPLFVCVSLCSVFAVGYPTAGLNQVAAARTLFRASTGDYALVSGHS